MTAIEWLVKELNIEGYDYTISIAKEMHKQEIRDACGMALSKLLYQQAIEKQSSDELHKQQIIDAYYGYELYLDREFRFQQGGQAKILTFDQWYETYGSKGSNKIEKSEKPINLTSSQTEINGSKGSDETKTDKI